VILTDLTQFKVQRRRAGSKWIREYGGVEINITEKKVQIQRDTPGCGCVWQGNLVDYFDKDVHECKSCRFVGDKNPRGMTGKKVWNKGLTKESDERIKILGQRHSAAMSGESNPWFGVKADLHPCYGKALKGAENHFYKDGKCYERVCDRFKPEQRQWAKRVKDRGGYTCQACQSKGVKLVSHHLFSYSTHPELRNEDSNGICLCTTCHKAFHKWNGGEVKPCTPNDYANWLRSNENTEIQAI
jgi:5-methylcytosine-specific restriction endonuclease McrA